LDGLIMEIFAGWDEWKSAMMTLPEDAFFDLLRSVFGHIKTPFNKQNLLSDLAAFLSRDDIRRNIAAYIDEADAQVIAAVALLENPTAAELENFFAGESRGGDLEISILLLNLEERFILYRYRDGAVFRLGLNPVLMPVIKPFAEDMSRIFPSLPAGDGENHAGRAPPSEAAALDDRIFAALISFVLEEGSLFRAEGRLRKKVLDSGGRIFPGVDLELMIRSLLCLGLCRGSAAPGALPGGIRSPEEEILMPEDHALGAFRNLEPRHRRVYWAAGLYLGAELSPELMPAPQLLRGRVRRLAQLIDRLLEFLSPLRVYPIKTLRRILFFLEWEEGKYSAGQGSVPSATPVPAGGGVDAGILCAVMARAGLLCAESLAYRPLVPAERSAATGKFCPGGSAGQQDSAKPGTPVLVIDAPFFCLVYPGIEFADVLALASFTAVRETGAVFRFEISRESCLRGFERGLSAADMGELLARLSGNRLEPSLLWTLRDWEKRSTEVSLFEGAVLVLSPERRYLAATEALAALIRRELAPGLYLLDSGDQAAEALRKAGVDMLTRYAGQPETGALDSGGLKMEGLPGLYRGGIRGPFPALEKQGYQDAASPFMAALEAGKGPGGIGLGPAPREPAWPGAENAGMAETLKARFRAALAGCTLSRPERNELAARIERRLVLSESQLSSASVRGEKLEARGLDYVGKTSIAKQALNTHSLVEVLWSAADREQRIAGVPLALEKSGGESILVIEDSRDQEDASPAPRAPGNTIRIPVGKISLLRRIKKSIFET
jgi:hypothetical protein